MFHWIDLTGKSGQYTGFVNENDIPNGNGVMKFEFGLIAEGERVNSVLNNRSPNEEMAGGATVVGCSIVPGGGMSNECRIGYERGYDECCWGWNGWMCCTRIRRYDNGWQWDEPYDGVSLHRSRLPTAYDDEPGAFRTSSSELYCVSKRKIVTMAAFHLHDATCIELVEGTLKRCQNRT